MMKFREKIKEIIQECGNDMDLYLGLTTMGSLLNLIENGINELNDDDISMKLKEDYLWITRVENTKEEE